MRAAVARLWMCVFVYLSVWACVCVCVCVLLKRRTSKRKRRNHEDRDTWEARLSSQTHHLLILTPFSLLPPPLSQFLQFPFNRPWTSDIFFHFFKSTHTDLTYVGNDTSVSYWFFLGLLCVFSFLLSPSLPPPFFKHCLPSLSLLYSRKASCAPPHPPIPSSPFFSLSFFL